jgi:hypothetical protein
MKRVTIDQYDIKEHVRWAKDQAACDSSLVHTPSSASLYSDVGATSAIYSSELEALFAWERGMQPWANFSPPENLFLFNKRFFSYRLFPHIQSTLEEDMEEELDEEKKKKNLIDHIRALHRAKDPKALFEKDKKSILSLLEAVKEVDAMLALIFSSMLRYQKG